MSATLDQIAQTLGIRGFSSASPAGAASGGIGANLAPVWPVLTPSSHEFQNTLDADWRTYMARMRAAKPDADPNMRTVPVPDIAVPLDAKQQTNITEAPQPPATPQMQATSAPTTTSATMASLVKAIYGQESGSGSNTTTSTTGAVGGMQIEPATFQQYAKPGEYISNPADNMAVGQRIIADLWQKSGGDPARVAVGYFSGPGNMAPPDSPTPWIRNAADPTGKAVSSYVGDILKRLGSTQTGATV